MNLNLRLAGRQGINFQRTPGYGKHQLYIPTPLTDFGYPLDADSDGLGKPPELPVLLPVYGQGQHLPAKQKAQRTTQLTAIGLKPL
jgi:hypothetical protein